MPKRCSEKASLCTARYVDGLHDVPYSRELERSHACGAYGANGPNVPKLPCTLQRQSATWSVSRRTVRGVPLLARERFSGTSVGFGAGRLMGCHTRSRLKVD